MYLQGIVVNANAWTNGGHAVNQIYDILYMMGRDDIAVGVGGEGGILPNGTILPNVGGYLPIIEQVCGILCLFVYGIIIYVTFHRKKHIIESGNDDNRRL